MTIPLTEGMPNPSPFSFKALFARDSWSFKVWAAILMGVLANLFFYDAPIGWGWGLFQGVLVCLVGWFNPTLFQTRLSKMVWMLSLGLSVAMVIQPNPLTILMSDIGWLMMLLLACRVDFAQPKVVFIHTILQMLVGWVRPFQNIFQVFELSKKGRIRTGRVLHFLVPITLLMVFTFLFADANPVLTQWLDWIDWTRLWEWFSIPRILLFGFTASMVWMVLRPRLFSIHARSRRLPVEMALAIEAESARFAESSQPKWLNVFFSHQSLVFTLVAFNALFLLQNVMDIQFLWAGQALPKGMTYADYAHQGSYPLICTALLAGLFVMVILQPLSQRGRQPALVSLVLLWLLQNVFLTASSIWRLWLYVEVYSLSHLRLASFVWMGLVLMGLLLLGVRVWKRLSNAWLVRNNLLMLGLTLYALCFVNQNAVIADYNVRHCAEVTGKGAALDLGYMERELGEDAILAYQWILDAPAPVTMETKRNASYHWQTLKDQFVEKMSHRRSWTLNRAWIMDNLKEEKELLKLDFSQLRKSDNEVYSTNTPPGPDAITSQPVAGTIETTPSSASVGQASSSDWAESPASESSGRKPQDRASRSRR